MPELVTITTGDVAARMRVSRETVRRWTNAGLLVPAVVTPGGHRRYAEADVDALVAGRGADV